MVEFDLTVYRIPLPVPSSGSDFEFSTRMSSVKYWFRFRWHYSLKCWVFDLLDAEKDPIKLGIRLVLGHSLLKGLADPRKPPGILMFVGVGGSLKEPGQFDLGKTVQLEYSIPALQALRPSL